MSERIKSLLLVVLCISMIGLFAVNLMLALDGGTELFRMTARSGEPDSGDRQSPAIMPEKLGINGSSGLKMASGSEFSEVFLSVYPMLTEALGSIKKLEPVTEEVFTGYLTKQGIYASFRFPVPLYLLQYCWTGEMTQTGDQAASVMVLAAGKNTVEFAIYDGSTGRFYAASTAGGYDRMMSLCEGAGEGSGYYAGWADGCEMLQPWDMLSAASEYYPSYSVSVGDLAAEGGVSEELLGLFDINPFLAKAYRTTYGDIVYIEGYIALQFGRDGSVSYSAKKDSGIELDISAELSEKESTAEYVVRIKNLLTDVYFKTADTPQLSLTGMTDMQDGSRVYLFSQMLSGAFISEENGCSAAVTVKDERIVSMRLWIRKYTRGQDTMLLPGRLSLALVDSPDSRLCVRYSLRENALVPERCIVKGGGGNGVG